MLISVSWLNRLLAPSDLTADEAERILTQVGFPIEAREDLAGGDVRLDVEVTSNRGDCMSHVGVAREIAAATGRSLDERASAACATSVAGASGGPIGVVNEAPDECPIFTAQVIRGVRVGPSPAWMREALEAVGLRSINNVVDVTNYCLMELGHPSHVFDMDRLEGPRIVVRHARKGERLLALDGSELKLQGGELVVADASKPSGLAGVIGGEDSSVTERTVNVALECATWEPATVRRSSRRFGLRTDASARYERLVDPRMTVAAARRIAERIIEVAGGALDDGMTVATPGLAPTSVVTMRAERCRRVIGVDLGTPEMARLLTAMEIDAHVEAQEDLVRCEVPAHRPDIQREIDLIEEVARAHGLDRIPIHDRITIDIAPPQPSVRAERAIHDAMTGVGCYEVVTFSFVRDDEAALLLPEGLRTLRVDEERRKGEPALRPSPLAGLLRCRRLNQDSGVEPGAPVRLYEVASGFAEDAKGRTVERRTLAMLFDAEDPQPAVREVRAAIEAVVRAMAGPEASIEVRPVGPVRAAEAGAAVAEALVDGRAIGRLGLLSAEAQKLYDIETVCAFAELDMESLLALFPPRSHARPLPAFPAIERDLSAIIDESRSWSEVRELVESAGLQRLETVRFVTTYRGKQIGAGRKSLTLRMIFRDPSRTLRHEEVDGEVEKAVRALREKANAELRA